jgi:hypothetical protein
MILVIDEETRLLNDPYNEKLVTCDKSKLGTTWKFFSTKSLLCSMISIFRFSKVYGCEKTTT